MHYGTWLGRVGLVAAALVAAEQVAERASAADAGAAHAAARCDGAIRHPIEVRVEPLDPVIAGGTVRLRLTAGAPSVALSRVRARIERAGGATVVGTPRHAVGRVERGGAQSVEFAVVAPAAGDRRLIEFVVEGEGPTGPLRCGAVFNLLPGGGEQPVRIVRNAAGERVAEYRARKVAP